MKINPLEQFLCPVHQLFTECIFTSKYSLTFVEDSNSRIKVIPSESYCITVLCGFFDDVSNYIFSGITLLTSVERHKYPCARFSLSNTFDICELVICNFRSASAIE